MERRYKLSEITPEKMRCALGPCPGIYKQTRHYFIIGEQVSPEEVGLAGKVGQNESLIKVKREMIDNRES